MIDTLRKRNSPLVYPAQGFPLDVVEIKQFKHESTLANPFGFLKVKTVEKKGRKGKSNI